MTRPPQPTQSCASRPRPSASLSTATPASQLHRREGASQARNADALRTGRRPMNTLQGVRTTELLPQPDGLNRFGFGVVVAPPEALSVPPLGGGPERLVERRVATRGVTTHTGRCDRQVAEVAHGDDVDDEVGQKIGQVPPPAADSVVAVIAALDRDHARDGLHVSVHQRQEGPQVTSVEGVIDLVSQFHVRLRHRDSSIPFGARSWNGQVGLSRRVEKVVGYPPLWDMSTGQRREFHEALLDAGTFEDLPGKWQAAILEAGTEPTEAAGRVGRLVLFERSLVSRPHGFEGCLPTQIRACPSGELSVGDPHELPGWGVCHLEGLRLIRSRPAEDLDPYSIRVEDEGRVVAADVTILFGREMNLVAARQTTLVRGIDLVAAVDLEREMLDPHVVVVVRAAVSRSQSQICARPEVLEIDDFLGSAVGGIAGVLGPSEWSQ
jgi:hypothetical protein